MRFRVLPAIAIVLSLAQPAGAQEPDPSQLNDILERAASFDAACTRSVVTLVTRFPMRCVSRPMLMFWPNGRVSMIFIAVDPNGEKTNVSFNAGSDDQPTLRQYVMNLSDVRMGPLNDPASWKQIPVKGRCEIRFRNDAASVIDGIACVGRAPENVAVFDFSVGPGRVIRESSKAN